MQNSSALYRLSVSIRRAFWGVWVSSLLQIVGGTVAIWVPMQKMMDAINRGIDPMTQGFTRWLWEHSCNSPLFVGGCILFLVTLVAAHVYFLRFIYLCWTIIPPARRSTTPLKASLLLLVPIFNLFWVHVAFYGFAKAANALTAERGQTPLMSEPLAKWMAPCALLSLLPSVGAVFALIFLLLLCGFFLQAYKGSLALCEPPPAPFAHD